ncbi:hypothetical protein P152DRAFT_456535 [Eremomyces bilateralis CBS 781.70]|uniref:Uncharacterized protein n=1 Tax=Eremomyces bilateralis CBS 781.70 TaxID=1392243 RepID=A0A6G1G8A4_9PEZI|nr:uncharacterized protein P152DRAFT_456535 [Eremomyces bilateralis CBS 781.70]KAF1814298.1 hypothetical protein P152DRAFT_456535 [Eremomyces bilateralis CBS 781.70]
MDPRAAPLQKSRRQLAADPQRESSIRPDQAARPRSSARFRAKDSMESSVSHAPQPVQASPIRPARISPPAQTKRKRSQEDSKAEADKPKGEHVAKQPRRLLPQLELSEKNLRKFNGEEMDSAVNNATALKRSSSQRSIARSSETGTVRSKSSSNSIPYYRYHELATAGVYIHTDPPADIQAAINVIVQGQVSTERRTELHAIAQGLYDGCKKAVKAACSENDFLVLFQIALVAMDHSRLCLCTNADWREEIKPTIRKSDLNLSFLADFNAMPSDQQHGDTSASPLKRQKQDAAPTPISSRPSGAGTLDSTPENQPLESDIMHPPAPGPLEKPKERSPIKTPRPDISIGIQGTALISALSSQILDNTRAMLFLDQLQNTMRRRERGGPEEPLLIAVPTKRASDLVFPFAIVEGKGYSTGKQVFEAQNQAAVSGASGLRIQVDLNELVERATSSDIPPVPSGTAPELFFSVCTEGPYHELWAHYTYIEDGVRNFSQILLEICNALLLKSVENFLVVLDLVLGWGTGQFLESVAERLGQVAKKAEA